MRTLRALTLLAVLTATPTATAWTDARPAGLVTEVALDRDGGATVTLRVRWRVLAGRFRTFDLNELPADFALLEATATDASGNAVPVATRVPSPGRLEVSLGEEGGMRRGAVDVTVRYTTSLRAQGSIRRVGDDAVVEMVTVPWERGLEATELRVALPAGIRRARWVADETPGVDATVTSELGRDVVHAIRRHVPASAQWTAHVACDPTLFAWLDRPRVATFAGHHDEKRPWWPTALLALALSSTLAAATAMLSRRRPAPALIPLAPRFRALPWMLACAGGLVQSLVMIRTPGVISAGAALACAGLALCVPRSAPASEEFAPARWWPEPRALALVGRAPLTRAWPVAVALALAALGCAWFGVARQSAVLGVAAVDLALLALAATAVLPRRGPRSDASVLSPIARELSAYFGHDSGVRLAWRVRGDGSAPSSTTVRVVPRQGFRFTPGVRAIECVVEWQRGLLRWHASTALIVRTDAASSADAALRSLVPGAVEIAPSSRTDESVFRADLAGRSPTRALASVLPTVVAEAESSTPSHAAPSTSDAGDERRMTA